MRFDFIHGDMVSWLAGEYTNRHRDWTDTFQRLQTPPRMGQPRDLPPPDFPRAQRI
jgi:plasmid stabilization system protein ParE